MKLIKRIIFCGFGLASVFFSGHALATCKWLYGHTPWSRPPDESLTIYLPTTLTMKRAAVGGVLAEVSETRSGEEFFSCTSYQEYSTLKRVTSLKAVEGFSNVYETGVEGVGVRFAFFVGNTVTYAAEYKQYYSSVGPVSAVVNMRIEFIRTGMQVGSGKANVNVSATLSLPAGSSAPATLKYGVNGNSVELINEIYFSSCESQTKTLNVPMGKVAVSEVRSGVARKSAFSFDVFCRGIKPSKPLPLKIYLEGTGVGPNKDLLELSNAGQAGVATGVAIAVTNGNGVKMPFDKTKAVDVGWQRSDPAAEVYRFSGSAQYVSAGGTVKPGAANAVATYVFEYN
ncbi:fimbrial protein [Burkholderia sp. GS2Y]|uniref:Fimbrial protein n=1 Tax=Burkholderia theae TaxID=3143496 RepID=A0ABU9WE33_9BURK